METSRLWDTSTVNLIIVSEQQTCILMSSCFILCLYIIGSSELVFVQRLYYIKNICSFWTHGLLLEVNVNFFLLDLHWFTFVDVSTCAELTKLNSKPEISKSHFQCKHGMRLMQIWGRGSKQIPITCFTLIETESVSMFSITSDNHFEAKPAGFHFLDFVIVIKITN